MLQPLFYCCLWVAEAQLIAHTNMCMNLLLDI